MKKILLPVDGSSNSMRAVKFAIAEAKLSNAELHLVHVIAEFDDYGMIRAYISEKQRARMMKARAAAILKRAETLIRKAKVACKVHVEISEDGVAERIAETARRLRCGLIVMGTRGMGTLGSLVLGSIATKVIHAAKVPVTLVK